MFTPWMHLIPVRNQDCLELDMNKRLFRQTSCILLLKLLRTAQNFRLTYSAVGDKKSWWSGFHCFACNDPQVDVFLVRSV